MNHEEIKFNQIKRDTKILMESFVSAFPLAENEKSLTRIIGGMEANYADCTVIRSCLGRVSDQCAELDLKAMEYEAKAILDRLDQAYHVSQFGRTSNTSSVKYPLLRTSLEE